MQVCGIVTGHDGQGRAVVKIDELIEGAHTRPVTVDGRVLEARG